MAFNCFSFSLHGAAADIRMKAVKSHPHKVGPALYPSPGQKSELGRVESKDTKQ